jgi:hypothetical protein
MDRPTEDLERLVAALRAAVIRAELHRGRKPRRPRRAA